MFKKPFKVKSNTQMKGCDKKKLKLELIKYFPVLSAENLKEILPPKDDLTMVKILTHSGEAAHFYCVDKIPILFCRERKIYPTLHLLWKYPDIIPFFATSPEVLPVLHGGANFMIAGILPHKPRHQFGNVNKGDTMYINLSTNKAAVAVGEAALSSHDMYMCGGRGKCVNILHVLEDELCKFGNIISIPPELGPTIVQAESSNDDSLTASKTNSVPLLYANVVKPRLENYYNSCPIIANDDKVEDCSTIDEKKLSDNEEKNSPSSELSPADDLVIYCFLKALNTSMKNVKLPLLVSNFYKVHMIPACPEDKTIDIKKSSYKKMSKFMQQLAADNIITVEESSPGVQSINYINYSHHLVSGFIDKWSNECSNMKGTNGKSEPKICEKYLVTAAVVPLFSEFLMKKGDSMTVSETRKYIAEYIRKHQLPLPDNHSMVKLNAVLKNIIAQGVNDEVPEVVKWEEIMNRVLYKMSHSFKITTNGSNTFSQKEQKGKLPLIDIRIANKSGNKKVTLINNLEAYGINIEEFSRECQRGVAASATINQINNSKNHQLQIQGNQINFIEKILVGKYNIPKKYMNGLQFAPKKK